jgi:hypothetical protein
VSVTLHKKLVDIEHAPAFDPTCNPRCDSSRATLPLAQKLLYVPHYNVASNLDIDPHAVKNELAIVEATPWLGYNNDVKGVRGAGVSTYWCAKFLRNFVDDSNFGFGETLDYMEILGKKDLIVDGRVPPEHLVKTDLYYKVPYIVSLIKQFVTWDMCDRILISRVDNNQRINWHSHNYYEPKYTHAYLHIPLVTSDAASMLVYMDKTLHTQHYGFDEAWVINTQHNHAVSNTGGDARYHILVLANFEDPKFNALFLD